MPHIKKRIYGEIVELLRLKAQGAQMNYAMKKLELRRLENELRDLKATASEAWRLYDKFKGEVE